MIPDEEVMDILILLWHGHLGFDQVEEEGGGHDGPAVDHGVVGLPVVVQHDLIEVPPTGFSANVLLDHICPQLVQTDGVGEGFTAIAIHITWYMNSSWPTQLTGCWTCHGHLQCWTSDHQLYTDSRPTCPGHLWPAGGCSRLGLRICSFYN